MVGNRRHIEVEGFFWDFDPDGNVEHRAQHDVRIADVNAVLAFEPLFFQNAGEHAATYAMIGRDSRQRSLIIYLVPTAEGGVWKPITGWRGRLAHRILEQEGRI